MMFNKKILFSIILFTLLFVPLITFSQNSISADELKTPNIQHLKLNFLTASFFSGFGSNEPEMVALNIWSAVLGVSLTGIGTLFIIYLIYAGYNLLTARGNEEKVEKAKKIISTCIIGIIIVALSYLFTAFIIEKAAAPLNFKYERETVE